MATQALEKQPLEKQPSQLHLPSLVSKFPLLVLLLLLPIDPHA
jgi:hypothetical protein